MLFEKNRAAAKITTRRRPSIVKQKLLLPLAALMLATTGMAQAGDTTISHGISTFGDLKYTADFAHLDYVNPAAPKGGEIVIANERGTFDSFNSYARKGVSAMLATVAIERLMTGTADEIGSSYCFLCETLEYPEGKEWVIFTLRSNITFSDGTPVKASDVVYTHELFMEQGLPSYREGVSRIIANVEALDDFRVKFTFVEDSPINDRIDQAGANPVFSQTWMTAQEYRLDETNTQPIMGTGAYALDSFEINERITYRRNPDYWGNDLAMNIGRNNFDTIRIEYFADGSAAFEGFKAGEYTFRIENSSKQWATGYDFPNLQAGHVVKAELHDGAQASGQAFVFNMRRERFKDARVREALGLMFNFEWSNETLFFGLYARINSFAENSYLAAMGTPGADELAILEPIADLLPAGVLTDEAIMAPGSGARQLDRANLRRASELLDAAGWEVGDDGIRRNAAGETLVVEFLERSPAFDRVINPYVENLIRLGVEARLNRVDNAQYVDRRYAFDYDVITDHMGVGYEPGSGLAQSLGSADMAESVFNSPGVADPAVDALIEIIRNAETKDELVTAVKALDRVMRAMKFWVPQWFKDVYTVAYFDMYEHPDPLPPYDLGYLDFWWFNADKHAELLAAGVLH